MTIGFRVKSGHAIAVVLDGPADSPRPVGRRVVLLSDPDHAETRQPYHSGFGAEESDAKTIARRVRIIERCAQRSVDALLGEFAAPARRGAPRRATLVVGSVIDPSTVANPHIRAHAHEGRLFRSVLQQALAARGIDADVVVEKVLPECARAAIGKPPAVIARGVAAFGKVLGKPWRGDEKHAAVAAWMALGR